MKKVLIVLAIIIVFSSCTKDNSKPAQWEQIKSFPVNYNAAWIVSVNDTLVVSVMANSYNSLTKIFISSDFGKTWVLNSKNLDLSEAYPLITDGKNLYAGSWGNGVYFSSNMGKNWISRNIGLPTSFAVMDLVKYNNRLFVCGPGIYYSDDSAKTWHNITYPGTIQASSVIQIDTNIISSFITSNVTCFYKTSANNINWIPVDSTNTELKTLRVKGFFLYKDYIYTISDMYYGIYVSSDKGKTWVKGTGFDGYGYNFAAYNDVIFAACGDAVFKSLDFGKSWINIGCYGAGTVAIFHNTLYAGTGDRGIWKLALE
jgi:hypothetical protein